MQEDGLNCFKCYRMDSTSGITSVGCRSYCFAQKDTKNSNMAHSNTTHEHLTHWKLTNCIDVNTARGSSGNPF